MMASDIPLIHTERYLYLNIFKIFSSFITVVLWGEKKEEYGEVVLIFFFLVSFFFSHLFLLVGG